MPRTKVYAWSVVAAAALSAIVGLTQFEGSFPFGEAVFWVILLAVAELLPVGLGFETRVTMGFPILLAIAILFPPGVAIAIAGAGSFDSREFTRSIPPHRAAFNHAQVMLAVGAESLILHAGSTPFNAVLILLAALT